jgi:internalin A
MKRMARSIRAVVIVGLITLIVGSTKAASTDEVQFAEPALADAVRYALGLSSTQPITESNLASLTAVGTVATITNFGGIQYATNLWLLSAGLRNDSDISALTQLPKLSRFDLRPVPPTPLTDAAIFLPLTNLNDLDISHSFVTNLEVLSALPSLRRLTAHMPNITNAQVFSSFTNLFALDASVTDLHDFTPLLALSNLRVLDLGTVPITNLTLVGNMTQLVWLTLANNNLVDCSFLSNMVHLQTLRMEYNKLRDISSLRSLTNLYRLDVTENQITDISVATNFPKLVWLIAPHNWLTNLPSTGLDATRLVELDVRYNFLDLHPGTPLRAIVDQWGANYSPQAMPGNVRIIIVGRDEESITLRFESDRPMIFTLEQSGELQGTWFGGLRVEDTETVVLPTQAPPYPALFFRAGPRFLAVP